MPLVFQQDINEGAKIGVWEITEEEGFFLTSVKPLFDISHPLKRIQHLAGRYLLQTLEPAFPLSSVVTSPSGKPVLENNQYHFSITHTERFAAVIISENAGVGIDLERTTEKILRISPKFTDKKETALLTTLGYSDAEAATIIWNIKESLFKWYGAGSVDFRRHLQIESIMQQEGVLMADCTVSKEIPLTIRSISFPIQGMWLSYVCR
jgi:phosphopantetheinyl transferase